MMVTNEVSQGSVIIFSQNLLLMLEILGGSTIDLH